MLTPRAVRDLYLRGINLGAAWSGSAGDAAMALLMEIEISKVETLMGIHFRRYRILTLPETTLVAGTDYDRVALPIPYSLPLPAAQWYQLTLHFHDVQAVTRVRLYHGVDTQAPPQGIFTTLPLAQMSFSSYHERLYVPRTLVDETVPPLAWAVDYLIGLGVLPPEVVQWILLGTAIQVLGQAGVGADVSGGIGGEELQMDGITERTNYGAKNRFGGIYAGAIDVLLRQQDMLNLSLLRFRYQNTLGDCTTIPAGALLPTQPYEQTVCTPRAMAMVR